MTESTPSAPKRIGKCRILGRLGHGKTSSIFRAFYEPLQKEVAVKVLKPSAQASAEIRAKFLNEARAIAKLDHENIVKVFDVVEESGHLLIIMELLKGRDLYRVVKQDGPIEPGQAVEMATQAARALQAAHRQQIIHRDVKPQNLMVVGRRNQVKLLDFGLAVAGATAGKAGTPHFMSPEQITGKRVEEKSDIYSLGATFFFLLTGKPPYSGMDREAILERHLEGKVPSVSRAGRGLDIPKSLDPVVKRMMAPVPGYRYPARDLIGVLEGLRLGAAPGRPRRTHSARAAAQKAKGPPIPLLIGGLVVLAAIVVVGALLLTGGKEEKKPKKQAEAPVVQPGPVEQQPVEPSIQNRHQDRQRRIAEAERLLKEFKAFDRANPNDYDVVIARYKTLWDDYGDTGAGQWARTRMKELELAKTAKTREAQERDRKEARRQAKKILVEELKPLMLGMKFGEAQEKIESFMLSQGEDPDLMLKYNRLSWAGVCLETLAEEINGNPKKLKFRLIRKGVPDEAVIESADMKGIRVKEGDNVRVERWHELRPREIDRLASRRFGFRNPKKLFMLSCLCAEIGLERQANDWQESAIARDETGEIQRLIDSLSGGWTPRKRSDDDGNK